MACEFSKDGKYFAEISGEGKLRIWNAASNVLEQEYTPSYHLKTPLSCFSFITGTNKASRRKKRKIDEDPECNDESQAIAVGTSSGKLLIYSIVKGDVEYTITDETNRTIRCLSSSDDGSIYSGVDQNVVVWNLQKRNVARQWKAGNDKVCSILVIPGKNQLLTASRNIKLWDLRSQTELKTYTGHASEVSLLHYVSPGRGRSTDGYFLSGSKNDRTLNCWNLSRDADGKVTAATFLMEDIPKAASVCADPEGSTWLAVTVRSGITHIYNHTLNGKSKGPLKPKKHVQVISSSTKRSEGVINISISAAVYQNFTTLRLAYGNEIVQAFEDLDPIKYKYAIVRQDPGCIPKSTEVDAAKVKTPVVGNDVHYLGPQTSSSQKRKSQGKHQELAIQNRFENLTLNHLDSSGPSAVPKSDNVAQLLVQGLHSNDTNILRSVLINRNPQTVKNTIKRLPASVLPPLVKKVAVLIEHKTLSSQTGFLWLKNLLEIHASILMANPEMPELLNMAVGNMQTKIEMLPQWNRLRGRAELITAQITASTEQDSVDNAPALAIVDKDSDASDNDAVELDGLSGSEYDWMEEEEEEEGKEEEGVEDSDIEVDGEIVDEMDESD